ncbi:hypothetical protein F0562_015824 [Nyssa sinensis]|uniref:Transcription factor TFIIB cyclin-like domain-containing protein n=1 Tax=Nyssa sinensis TaxID=561372 RepID=A0A5J4ZHU6_9ASTE|nr:hypothetical protein F0562_015824 [Nyssa sinensis]
MVWCPSCGKNCKRPVFVNGFLCCSMCGRVINEDNFSDEPTFVKNAGGQSQLAGNFVKTVQSDYSASRHRTLTNAHADMEAMLAGMNIYGGVTLLNPALAFYTIAVERNFTKGRKKELVEAACLYIACQENKKAFLLFEFSDYLRINVYELGAVFLLLCKLLSLEEHPIVQKPVDPSLFIHRFAERLLGRRNNEVIRTALRIIASMKRDWMQVHYTYLLFHMVSTLKCSKSEVIRVVHICEATLTKRLIEFENTESGGLTIEEFNIKAEELEQEYRSAKQPNIGSRLSGTNELLCEHKGSGKASFAHGLCESCYDDFIILSGGLEGGSAPPAFQCAERERMTEESTKVNQKETVTKKGNSKMPRFQALYHI